MKINITDIYNIISEVSGINILNIDKDKNLDNLGINSIQIIEIVAKIEETFDIEISDENSDIDLIKTVKDIVELTI